MKFSTFILLASVVSTSGFATPTPKGKAGVPAKKAEPAKKAAPAAPKKDAPKKKK